MIVGVLLLIVHRENSSGSKLFESQIIASCISLRFEHVSNDATTRVLHETTYLVLFNFSNQY